MASKNTKSIKGKGIEIYKDNILVDGVGVASFTAPYGPKRRRLERLLMGKSHVKNVRNST